MAQRYLFEAAGHPGLDVSGDGRGSNTLTGSFQVLDVEFNNGTLTSFAANFIQHSEGATPALYGEIRYNSTIPIPEPSGIALATLGVVGLIGCGRRRRKR